MLSLTLPHYLPSVAFSETANVTISSDLDVLKQIDAMLLTLDDKTQQLEALESILLNPVFTKSLFLVVQFLQAGCLLTMESVKTRSMACLLCTKLILLVSMVHQWSRLAQELSPGRYRYGYGNLVEVDPVTGL